VGSVLKDRGWDKLFDGQGCVAGSEERVCDTEGRGKKRQMDTGKIKRAPEYPISITLLKEICKRARGKSLEGICT